MIMKKLFTHRFFILSAFLLGIILYKCKSDGTAEQHARAVVLADSIRKADSIAWQMVADSVFAKEK